MTKVHRVNGDYIRWECGTCGISLNAPYNNYDYWFYHKPLFTARLSIFNIDITFSGGDHFSEGDFLTRQEFVRRFNPELKTPKMFFSPLILAESGEKMSKSRKNTKFGDPKKLIDFCRNNHDGEFKIPPNVIVEVEKDEEYPNFF